MNNNFLSILVVVMTGAGMAGLTYFTNNDEDPYITLKNQVMLSYVMLKTLNIIYF